MSAELDDIAELKRLTHLLLDLLEDPHPGLVTWRMALQSTISKISEFA